MAAILKKILIAEDEKPLAKALSLKLKSAGFEVDIAYDGEAALQTLKSKKYDLVLMDIMMPKKDGFTVLKELQGEGNATPVFVMSNLSQDEDVHRVQALGIKDYIVKSNTPLAQIVERIIAFFKKAS
jgi:DNA-binding response OmpR family regulator